ncbi:13810_t:CDS:1, partial [Racocetra persica]
SNAADNDDSMLVIKVDDDEEESNKSKNRPKETIINIKIQQYDKLKEENARLKKKLNKKN